MRLLVQLLGLVLILFGLYKLGQNIFFTTHAYPYFWRGIAADVSIICLTLGVLMLTLLPLGSLKNIGWIVIGIGIFCIFASSRVVLNPTSLWQYFVSLGSMGYGYRLFSTGRFS